MSQPSKREWLAVGLAAIVLFGVAKFLQLKSLSNTTVSAPKSVSESAQRSMLRPSLLSERLKESSKLVASAKKESHPGLIYRFACQVPASSPSYPASKGQIQRADRILDTTIYREMRHQAAKQLQLGYYEKGDKVDARVIEGKEPSLELASVFFDETTAYLPESGSRDLANTLLSIGFHEIRYTNGYGHGSSRKWKAAAAEEIQFGAIHDLCERVRHGEENPHALNSTVKNP